MNVVLRNAMKSAPSHPHALLAACAWLLAGSFGSAGEAHPGEAPYLICAACHGRAGEGTAAGPPLAGSEWVNGPAENLIRIQLRGLEGPVRVKGVTYDIPGGMAPLAFQNDEQIAAVLSFIRQSFGNNAPAVTPEEVAALRHEVGKPKLREADLIPPAGLPAAATESKYDSLEVPRREGTARMILIAAAVAVVATIMMRMRRNDR